MNDVLLRRSGRIGPHVASEDLERMIARERARDAALDADLEVQRCRRVLLEQLDVVDEARREYEARSYDLAVATARVLEEAGLS